MSKSSLAYGHASIWIQDPYGEPQPIPATPTDTVSEPQVVMMQVVLKGSRITLMFNRGDFNAMIANPNDRSNPVDITIAVEEF